MPPSLRPLRPILNLRNTTRHLSHPPRPRPPRSKPTAAPLPNPHPTPRTTLQRLRADARTTASILFFFLSWFPAWSFLTNNVFCIMSVTGPSMSPFLNADDNSSSARSDRVWVHMWRAGQGLERGMVVAYWSPTNPERIAVKRIIALEGDAVLTKPPHPLTREDVPFGHVWVEGDQMDGNKTMDSNRIGPVSKSLIVGRVGGVIWPWKKAGRIRWEDWKESDRVLVGKGTVEEIEFFH